VTKAAGRMFRIMIQAMPDTDVVRELKAVLKRLLRTHGFRAV
jgi:hypothetical protein